MTTPHHVGNVLLDIALDLTQNLPGAERYQRLVQAVQRVVPCDATALLRLADDGALEPIAVEGLDDATLHHRFLPSEEPRLKAILSSREPVRFAADDPRPDPYDGLVEAESAEDGHLHVHACMGCSLYVNDVLVGALTVDALEPGAFDQVRDQDVATFAALAAAAMKTAGMIDALERMAEKRRQVAKTLVDDALQREGGTLVGISPAMEALKREIALVADSDLAVLLTGETGSGKDLVARVLHARSPRADRPLVYVNCAALPESMAESELFGHRRGAFTGAIEDRAGKFELADGGTLLLDEIGELPLSIQATLLRALQSGEVQRVGSDEHLQVDVRILAATNRDLASEVKQGRFRADLYHRLSVYPVHVPSLRERKGDIPLLADHLLSRARARLGLGPVALAPEARSELEAYPWPGNVRELEHVLTRATLRASAREGRERITILVQDLDLPGVETLPPQEEPAVKDEALPSLRQAVDDYQRRLIRRALDAAGGNWSRAAELLQVDRSNLFRLAGRLGLR